MIVLDLDDFSNIRNSLNYLWQLKARFPKFKVTLWAVPGWSELEFLKEVSNWEWVEMGLHGWTHEADEVQKWDDLKMKSVLAEAEDLGLFVNGFHAPGWGYNPRVWEFLKEVGWFVQNHPDHPERILEGAKTYIAGGNAEQTIGKYTLYGQGWGKELLEQGKVLRVHGHMEETPGVTNNVGTLFPRLMSHPKDTEFLFISELFK